MRHILFFLLLSSGLVLAEDWTTTNGTTYRQVTILSHDTAFVTIMYADGGARIPLRLLGPELQARFGYDAKKAAADEAVTVAKDKADRAALIAQEHPPQVAAPVPTVAAPVANPVPVPAPAPAAQPLPPPASPFNGGLIDNGDFQQGDRSWQGDGKTPLAYARSINRLTADPTTDRGLIVQLDPSNWTRVYQEIRDPETVYTVEVIYRVVPGATFSKNGADYSDVGRKLNVERFDTYTLSSSPGSIFVTIGHPDAGHISEESFPAQLDSTEVQTIDHTFPAVPLSDTKTVVVAFPPGTGVIDILSVKVTGK